MVAKKTDGETTDQPRIAIVGAGISGLSAAYTLKKAGVWADVYEAGNVAGGRCRNDYTDGYKFYVGAGSTEPQWETTFAYLHELGIEDQVVQEAGEAGIGFFTNGKSRILRLGGSPVQTLQSFLQFLPAFPPSVYAQGVRFLGLIGKYQKKLDFKAGDFTALDELSDVSIYDWCHRNGYGDLCTYVLDPLVANMVTANAHLVSMGHVIMLFSLMTGMCSLKDGMGTISEALYAQVSDRVHFNSKVEEAVVEDGKVRGLKIGGKLIEADHVIIALDAVRTLALVPGLSAAQKAALSTCNYSRVYYYQFGLEKPLETLRRSAVFAAPTEGNWVAGVSQAHEDEGYPIILSQSRIDFCDRLAAMTEEERTAKIISETRKIVPEFPEHPKIVKNYYWDISVNLEGPGQFNAVNDLKRNHMDDVEGLHLAGDYLFLIASTEGSMDAGRRRAEDVLAAMGLPAPALQRPEVPADAAKRGPAEGGKPLYLALGAAVGAGVTLALVNKNRK